MPIINDVVMVVGGSSSSSGGGRGQVFASRAGPEAAAVAFVTEIFLLNAKTGKTGKANAVKEIVDVAIVVHPLLPPSAMFVQIGASASCSLYHLGYLLHLSSLHSRR